MNKMTYPDWTPIDWDGNPQMALDGIIFDCWRKSFRHGHVTIAKHKDRKSSISITFSFGANSDASCSGSCPGQDIEKAKKYVDAYVGEGHHFRSDSGRKCYEIWDRINNAKGMKSDDGIIFVLYDWETGVIAKRTACLAEVYPKSSEYADVRTQNAQGEWYWKVRYMVETRMKDSEPLPAGEWFDNHHGIYISPMVIAEAVARGFDCEEFSLHQLKNATDYHSPCRDAVMEHESLHDIVIDAENYLQNLCPEGHWAGYTENGDFGVWPNDAEEDWGGEPDPILVNEGENIGSITLDQSWLHGKYHDGKAEIHTGLSYVAYGDYFAQGGEGQTQIDEIHRIWLTGDYTEVEAFDRWASAYGLSLNSAE
ncbi:hypothetical protein UFOVP1492_8 [uncultured Caudovirales phage]|uniref:Uncharacterized protein n=1 Tax=uncultured Caudovirales phage TaxID=2100421 RepID=A0A6J5SP71_9CAUD|nr:hypothetical protein UFOVP1242_84 [uncultured Caudovirales phage]CAB4217069.1 hypothetical protein UFOVP1492_8 [uncultured Caudovirales phage]CAB5231215.1 hypothetical protein UFOVP1580_37 [uncultured Caudovirales phage]